MCTLPICRYKNWLIMIKKVICLLFTVSLLAILTACGGAASSTAEVTDNTTAVEAPTEVVNTEETLKEETPKVEEVVEEPEENKEEPEEFTLTVEYATDKLQKMADAYNALYDSKDEAEELAAAAARGRVRQQCRGPRLPGRRIFPQVVRCAPRRGVLTLRRAAPAGESYLCAPEQETGEITSLLCALRRSACSTRR